VWLTLLRGVDAASGCQPLRPVVVLDWLNLELQYCTPHYCSTLLTLDLQIDSELDGYSTMTLYCRELDIAAYTIQPAGCSVPTMPFPPKQWQPS
jgi:hypothetical protein